MEGLFAGDLAYLQDLYRRINETGRKCRPRALPALREGIRRGARELGGIWRYPLERLHEEVAYIAFNFHWPLVEILSLEHGERGKWVAEIGKINQRLNEAAGDR